MTKKTWLWIGSIVVIATVLILLDRFRAAPDTTESTYVGRSSCINCHQPQAASFHGSDHDLAMDLATDETVLGNFDDQTLQHHGITSRMFRRDNQFIVHTEGPDGTMQDFVVKYVFGIKPLQQYMVELERPDNAADDEIGRVQVLRISWDTLRNRWFYLNPPDVHEKLSPNDPLHWTGITQNWNLSCASCHSTNLKKNFNLLTGEYRTTFSEIDVSCEACHGPGSLHVELASRKSLFWDRQHGYGLVNLKTNSNRTQIETCAPCHSRRGTIANGFEPGCNFDDYFALQLASHPIYHRDGQIRDEDYVYGSFIQSKMYHNGIRCTDCHDPHSTKVKFSGNQLCTSCHQHPAGKYDSPSHHHHQPGSPGASCVECHMPATTYMQIDSRRDHSLRVPRPDLSVALGTPNACTGCHIDDKQLGNHQTQRPLNQYLDWIVAAENGDSVVKQELKRVDQQMLEAVKRWYPTPNPDHSNYFEQLALGLSDQPGGLKTLNDLATDSTAPALFRASALAELATDATPQSMATAIKSLGDPSPDVAAAALIRLATEINRIVQRQQYIQPANRSTTELESIAESIVPHFDHSSRRVRIEAARVFVLLPEYLRQKFSNAAQHRQFDSALDELKKSLSVDLDRANSHRSLGSLYEMLGNFENAKTSYRAAIAVEPNVAGPRSNLAALLDTESQTMQQELQTAARAGQTIPANQIQQLTKRVTELTQQTNRLRAEEHELLARDIQRSHSLSDSHQLHHRYAMSCYLQGDLAATEKHLLTAISQQPQSPVYQLALATYYLKVEKPSKALTYIRSLRKSDPQNIGYQNLLKQAQEMLGR